MILVCPSCLARYLVPASAFVAGPRAVRCAKCNHQWQADTPRDITVVSVDQGQVVATPPSPPDAIEPVSPPPSAAAPVPALRSPVWLIWLRHYGLAIMAGALFVLFVGLLAFGPGAAPPATSQQPAIPEVKQTAAAVTRMEDGLVLQNVRSERRLDNAVMVLDVAGEIVNNGKEAAKLPRLTASALSPNGESIQSWPIMPPVAMLEPGGRASFKSSFNLPQASVSEISLRFSGIKDDE